MAKNDDLKDFVTDIADTIRTLTKTTEPINPQDFTTKMHDIKEDLDTELNEQDTLLAELESSVEGLPEKEIDLSETTATESDVREGKEFFNASGEKVTGTYKDMLQAKVDITKSCSRLFYDYEFDNVDFIANLDTSKVTNMSSMFYRSNVNTVPPLDCSNVLSVNYMFAYGKASNVDLSPLKISKVTDMSYMCRSNTTIKTLNISGWDTSKVTTIQSMFATFQNEYSHLEEVVGELDLLSCTTTTDAFYSANTMQLQNITLKNIKVSLSLSKCNYLSNSSLINTIKELWTNTGTSTLTLTIGTANLAKLENVYVKLINITDEMRAEDEYIDNKAPFEVCESTDEGAMLVTEYVTTVKNWSLA